MENKKFIRIRGAAENNLKHIDLDIPRDELVVLTGLSGSGNPHLHLTQYMQRVRGDTWSRFHLMQDNF